MRRCSFCQLDISWGSSPSEPTGAATGTEMLLLLNQSCRGFGKGPRGIRSRQKVDVHPSHPSGSELDVAGCDPFERRRLWSALNLGKDRGGSNPCGAFGEYSRLGDTNARHIANGIHTGEARSQVFRADRDPAVLRHSAVCYGPRDTVRRDTQEQIVWQLAAVIQNSSLPGRIQRLHMAMRNKPDAALGEGCEQRPGAVRRRWYGSAEGDHQADLAVVANAAICQIVVQHQRGLAGRRRAFERPGGDPDNRMALGKGWQHVSQPRGSRYRIELMAALRKARCGVHIVVRSKRHHQDVGFVNPLVGYHASCVRIDGEDCLLAKADPRFHDVLIVVAHDIGLLTTEHNVELGKTEDKRVVLVDQGEFEAFRERLG